MNTDRGGMPPVDCETLLQLRTLEKQLCLGEDVIDEGEGDWDHVGDRYYWPDWDSFSRAETELRQIQVTPRCSKELGKQINGMITEAREAQELQSGLQNFYRCNCHPEFYKPRFAPAEVELSGASALFGAFATFMVGVVLAWVVYTVLSRGTVSDSGLLQIVPDTISTWPIWTHDLIWVFGLILCGASCYFGAIASAAASVTSSRIIGHPVAASLMKSIVSIVTELTSLALALVWGWAMSEIYKPAGTAWWGVALVGATTVGVVLGPHGERRIHC